MNKRQKEVLKSQLDSEAKTLKELKQVYKKAQQDVLANIKALEARTDVENLQSIVYQKQYQEALKKQIDGILDVMNTEQFTTISDYLSKCYEEGYVGVMYDLHGQGIPLIVPINQEQVVEAITTDSKLSEGLYKRLGVDTKVLKDSIRANVSRGIAASQSWADVARNIENRMNIGLNRSVRIARTEGHRILSKSSFDAQKKAKEKGADIVKQWDAAMDKRTRPSHARVDGEIRELDEKFSNGLMFPGDPNGGAGQVVNCRCACLQRAKWALDEDELQTLKDRAEYFGLDKSKDFEDFKKKYLDVSKNDIYNGNESFAVGKSLGAKAKNYSIKLPDGEITHLTEGTRVIHVEVIAGKGRQRQIDEIDGLLEVYGGTESEWQKKKGVGHVDYDGESYQAELHWYEEPSVGKVKWKLKPDKDGNWFYED